MSTHRERSRKNTRIAQVAVLLLAGGAAAMAFVPAPIPSEAKKPGIDGDTKPQEPAVVEKTPDLVVAADVLSKRVMVQPLPAVAEATPPGKAAQTTGDPPPPPPPVVDTGIKYCGSIIGPRWSSALLSSGDTKEMVAEGQTFQGAKLVEVLANKVVVEDGAGRRDLTLEVRPATLFPDNSSVHAAATPGSNPDTIPPGFDKLPPEEQMRYLNEKRNGNIINGERVGKPPTTGVPPPRPAPRPMTPMTPKNEKPIGKEGR